MHEGPGFHARRPLCWRAGAAPPAVEDQLRVLAAVATLETQEAMRSEPGEAPAPELQAIQNRLDLLITLVTQLTLRELGGERPPAADLQIGVDRLHWPADGGLEAGPGVLELHLQAAYPEPLLLAGELTLEDGGAGLRLAALEEPVSDAWQKYVFRHHRRELARRQAANEEAPSS